LEKYKKEKEEKEARQYSFKPEINENSSKLAAGAKTSRLNHKKNIAEIKERLCAKEMKECTFTPNISSFNTSTKNSQAIFNSLYEEAKSRKLRREETTTKA